MEWITTIPADQLPGLLSDDHKDADYSHLISKTPYDKWEMQKDDAPILRATFNAFQPKRHLEFGTWQGFGTLCCLEECDATVWTINLLDGEKREDGSWHYATLLDEGETPPPSSKTQTYYNNDNPDEPYVWHQTDSHGYVGRLYREAGMSHRVCQIYCDSKYWDSSNYPSDFFDTIFVDGGHLPDVVKNDTAKGMQILRPGGIMLWHDFNPTQDVIDNSEVVSDVVKAITDMHPILEKEFSSLYWVERSLLLLGIKA